MDSVVQNYAYVVSPLIDYRDGLNITTTTSNPLYFYDSSTVFVTPELIPAHLTMPSPEVIRTSNVVNQLVEWVFSFQTSRNIVPARGYLNITVPRDVLVAVPNSPLIVLNQDTGIPYANVTVGYYDAGLAVRTVTVWGLCKEACPVGASFSFLVSWVRNPGAQTVVQDPVLFDLVTPEGYLAERGTTEPVAKLFSSLIPVRMQNLQIRAVNPVPNVTTTYEIVFSADADFSDPGSTLSITFPAELTLATTKRILKASRLTQSFPCRGLFNSPATCTLSSSSTVRVSGLFQGPSGQYGVSIDNITNPAASGSTSAFILSVETSQGRTVAARSTLSQVKILAPLAKCNQVCGACAGTNSTCTSCQAPSSFPLLEETQCVDSCDPGFFFSSSAMRCFQCSHACETCHGPGQQCMRCAQGYFRVDGACLQYCPQATVAVDRECVGSAPCSAGCRTCSVTPSYCLSCNASTVLDPSTGRCISRTKGICGQGLSTGQTFFINKQSICA